MTKKYKAAVIGCGWIGTKEDLYAPEIQPATHAGAYSSCEATELAALVDADREKLKAASKRFPEAIAYESIDKMMEEIRPDIVSVATPTSMHREHVLKITQFGCAAIFCEKPVADTVQQATELADACKKKGIKLYVNHQRRFDPLLRKWAKSVQEGSLGKVLQGHVCYYNGLYNNGSHWVDLMRMFLGEPEWVIGVHNPATEKKGFTPNIDGVVGFKGGARVSIQSLSENYGHSEMLLYGETGMLNIKQLGFEVAFREKIQSRRFKGMNELSSVVKQEGEARSMLVSAVEHIVACLENEAEPVSTGEDGIADLKILVALRKSAEEGSRKIELE